MKSFPAYVSQRSRVAGSAAVLICCVGAWMSGAAAITAKGTAVHTLPPTQQFDDVEFDASQPRLIPFSLIANWIVLSVKINGNECRMLLDSGAPNVISTSAAANLGLDVEGRYAGGALERGKSSEVRRRSHDSESEISCCTTRLSTWLLCPMLSLTASVPPSKE